VSARSPARRAGAQQRAGQSGERAAPRPARRGSAAGM